MTSQFRTAFLISLTAHLAIVSIVVATYATPAKYEIGSGERTIGVELIVTAPEPDGAQNSEKNLVSAEAPSLVLPALNPIAPKPIQKQKVRPTVVPNGSKQTTSASINPGASSISAPPSMGEGGLARGQSQPAAYFQNPPPDYPYRAREEHREGIVRLLASVNASGIPDDVALKETSGIDLLDKAALEAVRQWRFRPATVLGRPVSSQVEIPVRFKLEK